MFYIYSTIDKTKQKPVFKSSLNLQYRSTVHKSIVTYEKSYGNCQERISLTIILKWVRNWIIKHPQISIKEDILLIKFQYIHGYSLVDK